ncbi:MAG: hypothetical protein Q9176_008030 [Flavoplaca citrina]
MTPSISASQPANEHGQPHPQVSPVSDASTTDSLQESDLPEIQKLIRQFDKRSAPTENTRDASTPWACSTDASDGDYHPTVLVKTPESSCNSSDEETESEGDKRSCFYVRRADYYGGTFAWPCTYSPTITQPPPPYFLCPWPELSASDTPQSSNRDAASMPFPFLRLPTELRFEIYSRLLPLKVSITPFPINELLCRLPWALTSLSSHLHDEVLSALYRTATVVIWTKTDRTFRGTHRQAYYAWLKELDEGNASMIKHIVIDEMFSVKKVEKDLPHIIDQDSGEQHFDADGSVPCCDLGFNCRDPCPDPHCIKYDMDLKKISTVIVPTNSGNWELKWIWEFDVDKILRIGAIITVLDEAPAEVAQGLGKETIKRVVRAACGVEIEKVGRKNPGEGGDENRLEIVEQEVWPSEIHPDSRADFRQRVRDTPVRLPRANGA